MEIESYGNPVDNKTFPILRPMHAPPGNYGSCPRSPAFRREMYPSRYFTEETHSS